MSPTQDIALPSGSALLTAASISQVTAVEQARAVAEVQAAVIVAQQVPRDMDRAVMEMRDSCGRLSMANSAFYAVPNRGNGPTVHLARELGRIFGNLQFGVKELHRDDEAGMSEVLAFAWDCQNNTRSERSFQSPHVRMKGGKRQPLVDIDDIYRSNQNTGAKAVRECLFSLMPKWFVEEAQDICHSTLEHGEGKPLEARINEMVAAYRGIGIAVDRLETKLGRKKGAWTASDVAQMAIVYTSIKRDGIDKDEEFPQARVTAAEVTAPATARPPAAASRPPADDDDRSDEMLAAYGENP